MSSLRRTTALLASLLLALLPVLATGCGGGGHHHHEGTLEIENSVFSVETIEQIDITDPDGFTTIFDVSLDPGDVFAIDLFPEFYDIDVFWSDLTVDSFAVFVPDHETIIVVLEN